MDKQLSPKAALSEREVCEALGLSRYTVRQLRLSGQLAHVVAGRRILYPRSGLDAYLSGQVKGAA